MFFYQMHRKKLLFFYRLFIVVPHIHNKYIIVRVLTIQEKEKSFILSQDSWTESPEIEWVLLWVELIHMNYFWTGTFARTLSHHLECSKKYSKNAAVVLK